MSAATASSPAWFGRSSIVRWIFANPVLAAGILSIVIPTMLYVAETSWSTEAGAHGPIVLATGLWLIWRRWNHAVALAQRPPAGIVAALFVPALLAYFVARVTQIVELEGYLMYALLLVISYGFLGHKSLKELSFPLVYMLFIFPPPEMLVALVTQPLKIYLSGFAIELLHQFGYPIAGAGVTIQIGQYQLFVAEACSGLNSLLSLSAISLFYVYLRRQNDWKHLLVLMLAVVPVAIFANFIRILILILLTYHAGNAAAQGFLHNFAGITMFITALLTIFVLDSLLVSFWRRREGKDSANA